MIQVTACFLIPESCLRDLLCDAFEGGSYYWARLKQINGVTDENRAAYVSQASTEDGVHYQQLFSWMAPFIQGVEVVLTDSTEEGGGPPEPWILDRSKLIGGISILASKYPRHFANIVGDNSDADTGDAYLQCCLFGEIVFG